MSNEREKRARLSHACDRCRKRHVKCDGDYPICGNCKSVNGECSYSHPGSKRGYVETIDDRLSKIEQVLSKYLEGADTQHSSTSENGKDNADGPEVVAPTSDIVSMAEKLKDNGGNTKALSDSMSLMNLKTTRYTAVKKEPSKNTAGSSREKEPTLEPPLPKIIYGPKDLPEDDLFDHLIHIYFTFGYSFRMPIIHRPTFQKQIKDKDNLPSLLLLNSIFAMASVFSDDPRTRGKEDDPETAGDIFFNRALVLMDEFMDKPRLSTVQAFHLLAQFCVKSTRHSCRIWMFVGMFMRMSLDLGLNKDSFKWDISKSEKAVRNRLFWGSYVGEVVTAAAFGKTLPIYDYDVRLPYEIEDDGAEAQDVLSFTHMCKLIKILSNVLQSKPYFSHQGSLRNTLPAIDAALSSWTLGLPTHLQYAGDPDPAMVPPYTAFMHQLYNTTLIHLHRPYMDSGEYPNVDSKKICIDSAVNITKLARCIPVDAKGEYLSYTLTGYCLAQAGMIHQLQVPDPETTAHGQRNMEKVINALDALQKNGRLPKGFCGVEDCKNMLVTILNSQMEKLKENQNAAELSKRNSGGGASDGSGGDSNRYGGNGNGAYNGGGNRDNANNANGRNNGNAQFNKTIPTPPLTQQDMAADYESARSSSAVIKEEILPEMQGPLLQKSRNILEQPNPFNSPKSPQPPQSGKPKIIVEQQEQNRRQIMQLPSNQSQPSRQFLSPSNVTYKSNPTPEPSPQFPQQQLQYHQQSQGQTQSNGLVQQFQNISPMMLPEYNLSLADPPIVPSSSNFVHNNFSPNSIEYTNDDQYWEWIQNGGQPPLNHNLNNTSIQSSHNPSHTSASAAPTTVVVTNGQSNQSSPENPNMTNQTLYRISNDQISGNYVQFPISGDQNTAAFILGTTNSIIGNSIHGNGHNGSNGSENGTPQLLRHHNDVTTGAAPMDIENRVWNQNW